MSDSPFIAKIEYDTKQEKWYYIIRADGKRFTKKQGRIISICNDCIKDSTKALNVLALRGE